MDNNCLISVKQIRPCKLDGRVILRRYDIPALGLEFVNVDEYDRAICYGICYVVSSAYIKNESYCNYVALEIVSSYFTVANIYYVNAIANDIVVCSKEQYR